MRRRLAGNADVAPMTRPDDTLEAVLEAAGELADTVPGAVGLTCSIFPFRTEVQTEDESVSAGGANIAPLGTFLAALLPEGFRRLPVNAVARILASVDTGQADVEVHIDLLFGTVGAALVDPRQSD